MNDEPNVDEKLQEGRKFRGQFMDMVHPSSDVKVVDKANYASQRQVENRDDSTQQPEYKASRDFADEVSNSFEPTVKPKQPSPSQESMDDSSEEDKKSFESPFLPNVKVDKRPLGANEQQNEVPEWLRQELGNLSEPELPADDGGSGEPELELLDNFDDDEAIESEVKEPKGDDDVKSSAQSADHLPSSQKYEDKAKSFDMRAALENTMIQPQYKTSETAQIIKPDSPYAGSAGNLPIIPRRKHSVLKWITLYLLLAIAGAALGVLLYMSGWLDQLG